MLPDVFSNLQIRPCRSYASLSSLATYWAENRIHTVIAWLQDHVCSSPHLAFRASSLLNPFCSSTALRRHPQCSEYRTRTKPILAFSIHQSTSFICPTTQQKDLMTFFQFYQLKQYCCYWGNGYWYCCCCLCLKLIVYHRSPGKVSLGHPLCHWVFSLCNIN